MTRALLAAAAMAVAGLAWLAGGAAADWLGLDELDPLLRLVAVALALTIARTDQRIVANRARVNRGSGAARPSTASAVICPTTGPSV